MAHLIHDIDLLLTCDKALGHGALGTLRDQAIVVENGTIRWMGPNAQAPDCEHRTDATGCLVMPALVDMHTHAVWGGSRSQEFELRLAGANYADILEDGGGILSTVRQTRAALDDALLLAAHQRLSRMAARGVGTVEVKSGYGLSVSEEVRLLKTAREAGRIAGVRVMTTFLGAHTVPADWRPDTDGYTQHVIHEQLPAAAPIADFVDVYVDRGAFTVEQGRRILEAGRSFGLGLRIHAEQVTATGAAKMAASLGALSADHLERLNSDGVQALADAGTVAGLLPGAMLYLRDTPPPVAALREAGVRMAVATDLNPGSSPLNDLWTAATLATVTMRLTVEEALLGITTHAAAALGRNDVGTLAIGQQAPVLVIEPEPGEPIGAAGLIQHMGTPTFRAIVR